MPLPIIFNLSTPRHAVDYDDLAEFVGADMSMTHIYQPIIIKHLVESGGEASLSDIAMDLVGQDPTLLDYYLGRLMVHPRDTLKKRKVADLVKGHTRANNRFKLLIDEPLTDEQRAKIASLCEQRIGEYVDKFEKSVGAMHNGNRVPTGVRYQILARDKCCQACGVGPNDAELDVDHIIPASANGTDDPNNLQVLCSKCNRAKRNADDTNLVLFHKRIKHRESGCKMCQAKPYTDNLLAAACRDDDSRIFVYPKRHVGLVTDMIPAERNMCMELASRIGGCAAQTRRRRGRSMGGMATLRILERDCHVRMRIRDRCV